MPAINFPNTLTLFRLVCAPIIPLAFYYAWNPLFFVWDVIYPVGIFMLAFLLALTDLVDGALAKWLKQETPLGKRLDTMADFSFCASLFVTVIIIYEHFVILQFIWMIFGVYFAHYATTVGSLRTSGKIGNPNAYAKTGMCTLMISLLFVIFGTFWRPYFIWHMIAVLGVMTAVILTSNALESYRKPVTT